MPSCGSQAWLCDLPVRFDTYRECSHGCVYCFAQRKSRAGQTGETVKALEHWIEGRHGKDAQWCDWNIPLHWGGLSDPFQPREAAERRSLACLELLARTQYPVVISTKGRLAAERPWIDLIEKANIVVQISAVCSKYDRIEPGAPSWAERVEMMRKVADRGKRVIVRAQPYVLGLRQDVISAIDAYANAGVYGIIVEGMKRSTKRPGLVKVMGDWCFALEPLRADFGAIRDAAHARGLRFYAGENRLRRMGDSLTCCGIDGMDGFTPNVANLNHSGPSERPAYTAAMLRPGTGGPFRVIGQRTLFGRHICEGSFADAMERMRRCRPALEALGYRVSE